MFRFRKTQTNFCPPSLVNEVVSISQFDDNGTEYVSFVSQPCSLTADGIPNCSSYKLSELLSAGVPLTPVSVDSSLSPSEGSIEAFVSQLDNNNLD